MTHATDRQLLVALQLADSFFPTGMYAHSQGLESMVARRWVHSADDVQQMLANLLTWSVLPSDGVALLNARRAAGRADSSELVAIDWNLHAMKLPAETRAASRQTGRRILDESALLLGSDQPCPVYERYRADVASQRAPGTGAVALGATACAAGIPPQTALLMFCHSFAVGVLGAAQRLLPMTHSEAQQILHSLHEPIAAMSNEIQHRPWQQLTAFAPQSDIASMLHECDDLRMFAS